MRSTITPRTLGAGAREAFLKHVPGTDADRALDVEHDDWRGFRACRYRLPRYRLGMRAHTRDDQEQQ